MRSGEATSGWFEAGFVKSSNFSRHARSAMRMQYMQPDFFCMIHRLRIVLKQPVPRSESTTCTRKGVLKDQVYRIH